MTFNRKKGSLTESFTKISDILIQDEELMRLLYYPPMGIDKKGKEIKDPLDETLPNIVDGSPKYWGIADDRVVIGEKTSDLLEKSLCRVYIYEGRRRPVFENYYFVRQDINIDIYVHESFDKDMRVGMISDRVNELLSLHYVTGIIGKLEYRAGNPREAPTHYRRFLHMFTGLVSKK